ncbi:MAG: hypothetical protein GY880_02810 [Planctomycetaceae bacterium]|nr:hypothetical protein [Planctomycetaceae bacterium]
MSINGEIVRNLLAMCVFMATVTMGFGRCCQAQFEVQGSSSNSPDTVRSPVNSGSVVAGKQSEVVADKFWFSKSSSLQFYMDSVRCTQHSLSFGGSAMAGHSQPVKLWVRFTKPNPFPNELSRRLGEEMIPFNVKTEVELVIHRKGGMDDMNNVASDGHDLEPRRKVLRISGQGRDLQTALSDLASKVVGKPGEFVFWDTSPDTLSFADKASFTIEFKKQSSPLPMKTISNGLYLVREVVHHQSNKSVIEVEHLAPKFKFPESELELVNGENKFIERFSNVIRRPGQAEQSSGSVSTSIVWPDDQHTKQYDDGGTFTTVGTYFVLGQWAKEIRVVHQDGQTKTYTTEKFVLGDIYRVSVEKPRSVQIIGDAFCLTEEVEGR